MLCPLSHQKCVSGESDMKTPTQLFYLRLDYYKTQTWDGYCIFCKLSVPRHSLKNSRTFLSSMKLFPLAFHSGHFTQKGIHLKHMLIHLNTCWWTWLFHCHAPHASLILPLLYHMDSLNTCWCIWLIHCHAPHAPMILPLLHHMDSCTTWIL